MKNLKIKFSLLLLFSVCCLCGCSDMVEIQDRDFVLALGVSFDGDHFQLSYALPDLGTLTEQATENVEKLVKTYQGDTLPEIAQQYNANSSKRLDYRHLKAVVLDESIAQNEKKMTELTLYLDNEYDISRNVLVFFSPQKAKDFLIDDEDLGGSIGDYLEKLSSNNRQKTGLTSATIGDLIDGSYNDKVVVIPTVKAKDASIYLDGGIILFQNVYHSEISEETKDIMQILNGIGTDYIFPLSPDYTLVIKSLSSKTNYQMAATTPTISYKISGTAQLLPRSLQAPDDEVAADAINLLLNNQMEQLIEHYYKKEGLDFLNLYRTSSYKNRSMWMNYENRLEDFIKDLQVFIDTDIKIH